MSQELTSARRALNKVSTDLKQAQLISAVTAIRDGARLFNRVPMIKNEQEEMHNLLTASTDLLRYNAEVARIFPLAISYAPGEESALVDLMNQLIEALQQASIEDALRRHREYQEAQLAKGYKELTEKRYDDARKTLDQLAADYSDDAALVTNIGEMFIKVGLYEDALRHLELAVKLKPDSAYVLNRLGIAQRKLRLFEESEQTYLRAVSLEPGDPNLHFNMGRLYLDLEQWGKAEQCGRKALELKPDFAEAAKMISYAEKQRAAH